MGTIKVLLNRFSGSSRSSFEYESYKYEDIQSNWIIHQGYLQYLYSTRILNDSLCMFHIFPRESKIFFFF
jgi:hypothetical protein